MECFNDCLYDVYGHSVIISMHWVFEGLRYILIHANTCKYWVNTITYKTIHIYTDQYIPVVARRRSVCPRMHCPAGGILQEFYGSFRMRTCCKSVQLSRRHHGPYCAQTALCHLPSACHRPLGAQPCGPGTHFAGETCLRHTGGTWGMCTPCMSVAQSHRRHRLQAGLPGVLPSVSSSFARHRRPTGVSWHLQLWCSMLPGECQNTDGTGAIYGVCSLHVRL